MSCSPVHASFILKKQLEQLKNSRMPARSSSYRVEKNAKAVSVAEFVIDNGLDAGCRFRE